MTKSRKQKSIRAQFAALGYDLRTIAGAVKELNRLSGELRAETARRLKAEQDTERLNWLEWNAPKELRVRAEGNRVEIARWRTRYLTYHSWTGSSVRDAIDTARSERA